jgi:hypothetical protein
MIHTPRPYDSDTMRLLEISADFLIQYFAYGREEAEHLVSSFLDHFKEVYDEDFLHHESSYRLAAMIHYFESLHGPRERLGHWLAESGYQEEPREALAYFREKYFVELNR